MWLLFCVVKEFGNELTKMGFLFLLTCSILLHVALNKEMVIECC